MMRLLLLILLACSSFSWVTWGKPTSLLASLSLFQLAQPIPELEPKSILHFIISAQLELGEIEAAIATAKRPNSQDLQKKLLFIAATALYLRFPLVTCDGKIKALKNLTTIW
ncbi:MAG: type II toxin-antitoxin system VapC family toxin [Kamptonema sp. SIO4C4]|nr:type II toxin-antitoxin system VapC family toxin [Kamptonema sp. SIO4C4]